jgi:hypothetical protein
MDRLADLISLGFCLVLPAIRGRSTGRSQLRQHVLSCMGSFTMLSEAETKQSTGHGIKGVGIESYRCV